ncbi:MAG: GNAT family N-acetyltransferase [Lachnospiraceae bacterium]|nr:GNAT family N-acetyltransferase [Lachnospiraceae bacterium]
MHRLYENNDIVVFWNSDKCFHSKKCVTGSPKTFDINRKPWIDVTLADNAEIWQTIEKCPSGALGVLFRHGIDVIMDSDNNRSVALDGDRVIGECDYSVSESGWSIYHTEVNEEYGGKGIAKRLVYKVIEAAEKSHVAIEATCSYAMEVIGE